MSPTALDIQRLLLTKIPIVTRLILEKPTNVTLLSIKRQWLDRRANSLYNRDS